MQGHQQIAIRKSTYDFLFDFKINYASILYRFRVIARFSSKVADFNVIQFEFAVIFGIRKLESWAIVRNYLRDRTFNRFDTIQECDRRTDRHTTTAYTTLA